ncbi:MMPL family transporter [Nocardia sp. NPDC059091]|uniref:MMPL family transporter n=1 Tax=unclassified Nocardia TaxID=2637762 RepID=UPI00369A2B16
MRAARRVAWGAAVLWIAVFALAAMLSGKLSTVEKNDASAWLPKNAESTQVAESAKRFMSDDLYPAVLVYDRDGAPVTAADEARVADDARQFAGIAQVQQPIVGPVRSEDGRALQLVVPIKVGTGGAPDVAPAVEVMRGVAGGAGLHAHVTGPAGYGADSANAFSGVSTTLLVVTLAIVIAILLLTYRSPVLWVLPLICVVVALTVAMAVVYLVARHSGLVVNSDSSFLLTVLVFGAGTDYALLLTARYREELRCHENRHRAMIVALRRAGPAIAASGTTVVASLLCLMVAEMNSTKSLGPVMAIGVATAMAVMVTLYPALLVLCGRWVFWPARPGFGDPDPAPDRRWLWIGRIVAARPRLVWQVTAVVLAAMALGLIGFHADGLQNKDTFRTATDAVVGERIMAAHFAGDSGDPLQIVGPSAAAERLRSLATGVPGIASVNAAKVDGDLVYFEATPVALTAGADSFATVDRLREAVHIVPGAKVGGDSAIALDTKRAARRDQNRVVPLVLTVVLVIVGLLLRAVVAPLLLLATVVLSLAASLGVSAFVFEHVFGFAGADASFPLWAFVFLISLGIDYSIFLVTRVREEAAHAETGRAAVTALIATGGTITSAGAVLAGTFAALTTLPLVFAVEIGFVVAFGVLLDTFVVRAVLVTALTVDLDRRMWWPGRLSRRPAVPSADPDQEPSVPARI